MSQTKPELETKEEILSRLEKAKKPVLRIIGADGNPFNLIGLARSAIKGKWSLDEWNAVQSELMSGDYDNLLVSLMKYYDVKSVHDDDDDDDDDIEEDSEWEEDSDIDDDEDEDEEDDFEDDEDTDD